MQQIYRGTPMSNCEFNKLHFGMGALLYIKFTACIFSEYIFLRTPLDGCFWYGLCCTLSSCINPTSLVNLHIAGLNERQKIFLKIFMTFLKKGVGVEIKHHVTHFREETELRVAPEKELEKPWVGPNTDCFWSWWPLLGMRKLAPKKLKNNFFLIYILFLKGTCTLLHCFYILRNVKRC